MHIDHEKTWEECLQIIKNDINDKSYETWFRPIKALKVQNNILTIQVPDKIFYEFLEDKFVKVLKKAIVSVLGSSAKLEYKLPAEIRRVEKASNKKMLKSINPFAIPGLKKMRIESNLNKNYKFDNYIEGDCNKMARSAGIAISKKPGKTSFNPLIIYGDVGLGKTHLAHAIGNSIKEKDPNHNVIYFNTDEFTNQIVKAIQQNSIMDLLNFYKQIDTIIIDDIQFLGGRTKSLEILFNIFNNFHQNSKQIILTSDRKPKDLEGMEERLISRFKWGLTADIQEPDFETRLAIFENNLADEEIDFPFAVKEYICYNVKSNIRELEGVCTNILAKASLNDREIDIELAKEVIDKFVSTSQKKISIENIKNLVASHYQLSVEELHSKSRKRKIVVARQVSMYLARKTTPHSLESIGKNFGGKDHSTVVHSIKQVKNQIGIDQYFKEEVQKLEKEVHFTLKA